MQAIFCTADRAQKKCAIWRKTKNHAKLTLIFVPRHLTNQMIKDFKVFDGVIESWNRWNGVSLSNKQILHENQAMGLCKLDWIDLIIVLLHRARITGYCCSFSNQNLTSFRGRQSDVRLTCVGKHRPMRELIRLSLWSYQTFKNDWRMNSGAVSTALSNRTRRLNSCYQRHRSSFSFQLAMKMNMTSVSVDWVIANATFFFDCIKQRLSLIVLSMND